MKDFRKNSILPWQYTEQEKIFYFQYRQGSYGFIYTTIDSQRRAIKGFQPVLLKQIHSNQIINIDTDNNRTGDGLYTEKKQAVLGIKVADCLPVYLFSRKAMCIIHCGWRGIIQGIAREARSLMRDYSYLLGAAIGPCCYDIKADVKARFIEKYPNAVIKRGDNFFLDLKAAVIQDLGSDHLVASLNLCTRCHENFFYSYRRGDRTKRNYALLMKNEIIGDN